MSLIEQAFPSAVIKEVNGLIKSGLLHATYSDNFFAATVDKEELKIPYRIYYNEPSIEHQRELSELQKQILNCVFSRHHDGFIRQKSISNIIYSKHNWATPFLVQIVGEYVIEILNEVYNNINGINRANLKNFLLSNKEFYKLTQDRVVSYWDCYYRMQFPKRGDYVGFKVLKHFEAVMSEPN